MDIPIISGEAGAKSPHPAYFLYYGNQLQAVRTERWKLHLPHAYRHYVMDQVGKDGHPGKTTRGKIGLSLFDMETDPHETTDVKDEHPDVVERMKQLAEQIRADLGDQGQPGPGIRPAGKLGPDDQRLQW